MIYMGGNDDEGRLRDARVWREHERMTVGSTALHALDPAEMAMRLEEAEADPASVVLRERESLRAEIFSGMLEYFFADGPMPEEIRLRVAGFLKSFAPEVEARMHGDPRWVTDEVAGAVLRKHAGRLRRLREASSSRGSLFSWARQLARELDAECVASTVAELITYLTGEGLRWRTVTARVYALAKGLRSYLVAGMSLEDLAVLSGDQGGRATPSARFRRLYNKRVEEAGMKGSSVHFQKSAGTVAKYAAAQKGNGNRKQKKGARGGAKTRRRDE